MTGRHTPRGGWGVPTRVLRASASTLTLGLGFPSNRSHLSERCERDLRSLTSDDRAIPS